MESFTVLTAVAAPMSRPNINTDDIWPGPGASPVAQKIGAKAFSDPKQAGLNAFSALRYHGDGSPRADFVLNQPPYDRAQILVAGANFGCGSSREMAVWALAGIGIRAIIAPSFGEIFLNNCFKNGILPVSLPQDQVDELTTASTNPSSPGLTIDLIERVVRRPDGKTHRFEVVEYYRQALLNGLDEISATSARMDRIEAFERTYRGARNWLTF